MGYIFTEYADCYGDCGNTHPPVIRGEQLSRAFLSTGLALYCCNRILGTLTVGLLALAAVLKLIVSR